MHADYMEGPPNATYNYLMNMNATALAVGTLAGKSINLHVFPGTLVCLYLSTVSDLPPLLFSIFSSCNTPPRLHTRRISGIRDLTLRLMFSQSETLTSPLPGFLSSITVFLHANTAVVQGMKGE